ncbi:MAG: hypothetical protein QOB17_10280, partial [Nitrososphaeraceae archaeon]|nr:hypothetical protein [Nitrososphaeraceae archaeon]
HWALWAPLKTTWYERFYDFYPLYLASSGGRTLVRGDSVLFGREHVANIMTGKFTEVISYDQHCDNLIEKSF